MPKEIFCFVLICAIPFMAKSQAPTYTIGKTGIGVIRINSPIVSNNEIRPINKSERDSFSFRPDDKSFLSLQIESQELKDGPITFKKVFIALDSSQVVKRIVLFVEGKTEEMVTYLEKQLEVIPQIGKAHNSISGLRTYYIWNSHKGVSVSLADFSDIYHSSTIQIDIVAIDVLKDPKNLLLYTVLKLPNNP